MFFLVSPEPWAPWQKECYKHLFVKRSVQAIFYGLLGNLSNLLCCLSDWVTWPWKSGGRETGSEGNTQAKHIDCFKQPMALGRNRLLKSEKMNHCLFSWGAWNMQHVLRKVNFNGIIQTNNMRLKCEWRSCVIEFLLHIASVINCSYLKSPLYVQYITGFILQIIWFIWVVNLAGTIRI